MSAPKAANLRLISLPIPSVFSLNGHPRNKSPEGRCRVTLLGVAAESKRLASVREQAEYERYFPQRRPALCHNGLATKMVG